MTIRLATLMLYTRFMEKKESNTPYTWDTLAIQAYEARQKIVNDKFMDLIRDFDTEIVIDPIVDQE